MIEKETINEERLLNETFDTLNVTLNTSIIQKQKQNSQNEIGQNETGQNEIGQNETGQNENDSDLGK
jgi:hypothetical protein